MTTQSPIAPAAIEISHVAIRQDQEGRYSLNDLHKASGGEAKNKPANWFANQQTKDLITEIEKDDAGIPASKIITGRGKAQGTYVVKELVYAYAMWISASFHLKVIRAYDARQQTPALTAPGPTDAAQIRAIIRAELAASAQASGHLLPPQQAKEITERLDRLAQMFHPFSSQFADVLGIGRALRGLHPNRGIQEPSYRRVIEHPADRKSRG